MLNRVIQIVKPSRQLCSEVIAFRDRLAELLGVSPKYPNR